MSEMQWNVFRECVDRQKIEVFDVFQHASFNKDVLKLKKKKLSYENFAKELKSIVMYYFWSKSECEVVITSWPPYIEKDEFTRITTEKADYYRHHVRLAVGTKVDVYQQLALNWDRFVGYVYSF